MDQLPINSKKGYSEGEMYSFRRNFNASRRLDYNQKVDVIKNIVPLFLNMDRSLIKSRCRKQENTTLKQLVATFIYINCPHMPYSVIGNVLGEDNPYDHATVVNSLKRTSALLETSNYYKQQFEEINTLINKELKKREDEIYDPDKYYYLDMSKVIVSDLPDGRAVVFVGMEMFEAKRMCHTLGLRKELKEYADTGLQIIKKLDKDEACKQQP